jgi:hypothetical protein
LLRVQVTWSPRYPLYIRIGIVSIEGKQEIRRKSLLSCRSWAKPYGRPPQRPNPSRLLVITTVHHVTIHPFPLFIHGCSHVNSTSPPPPAAPKHRSPSPTPHQFPNPISSHNNLVFGAKKNFPPPFHRVCSCVARPGAQPHGKCGKTHRCPSRGAAPTPTSHGTSGPRSRLCFSWVLRFPTRRTSTICLRGSTQSAWCSPAARQHQRPGRRRPLRHLHLRGRRCLPVGLADIVSPHGLRTYVVLAAGKRRASGHVATVQDHVPATLWFPRSSGGFCCHVCHALGADTTPVIRGSHHRYP